MRYSAPVLRHTSCSGYFVRLRCILLLLDNVRLCICVTVQAPRPSSLPGLRSSRPTSSRQLVGLLLALYIRHVYVYVCGGGEGTAFGAAAQ